MTADARLSARARILSPASPRASVPADSPFERCVQLAPGLTFSTHALAEQPAFCAAPPAAGELRLWLLRPEWQLLSKEQAQLRLSAVERRRAKTFPQPGIGKRFAVSRAVLRGILGGMTGCAPESLELVDHDHGRISLASPAHPDLSGIAMVYAGIWILIGIGAGPLGLATTYSLGDAVGDDEQHRVRLASVAAATGSPSAAGYLSQATDPHSHRVHTHDAGTWRVLDLPMPGRQCVAAVAARDIRQVHACGWTSSIRLPGDAVRAD